MGKLFATTVTSAKPREREYKLTDRAGLYLLVKPNGRKLWRMNYAYLGKQRTLEEVAQQFGITRERIRQIETKILRKLRHQRFGGSKLQSYLND